MSTRFIGKRAIAAIAAFSMATGVVALPNPYKGATSLVASAYAQTNNTGINGVVTEGTDWENPVVKVDVPERYKASHFGHGDKFKRFEENAVEPIECEDEYDEAQSTNSDPYEETGETPLDQLLAREDLRPVWSESNVFVATPGSSCEIIYDRDSRIKYTQTIHKDDLRYNNPFLASEVDGDGFYITAHGASGNDEYAFQPSMIPFEGSYFDYHSTFSYLDKIHFYENKDVVEKYNDVTFIVYATAGSVPHFSFRVGKDYKPSKQGDFFGVASYWHINNEINSGAFVDLVYRPTLVKPSEAEFTSTYTDKDAPIGVPTQTYLDGGTKPGEGTEFEIKNPDDVPDWIELSGDSTLTATPPAGTPVGSTYEVVVNVYTPEGRVKDMPVTFTVAESTAPEYTASYEDVSVPVGGTATTPIVSEDIPEGATFAMADGTPDWVTVDSDGNVSANPPTGTPQGETNATVVVTVDGETKDVPVKITVTEDDLDGSYDPITVAPGGEETSTPKGDVPEGSTFTPGEDTPEWVTVDDDGNVTANPPAGTPAGDYPVTITIETPGGQTQTVTVPVTVTEGDVATSYTDMEVPVGDSAEQTPGGTAPDGSSYEVSDGPSWVSVDPNTGIVTANPPAGTNRGDFEVTVTVTTPGGTTQEVPFTVSVTEDDLDGSYDPISVAPGGEETSTPSGDIPDGSGFTKGDGPDWTTVDPGTGVITANPPAGTASGDYPVTITITTPGGQTQTIEVPITVPEGDVTTTYTNMEVPVGDSADQTPGGNAPDGSSYAKTNGPDWVTIDPDTGIVTANPPTGTDRGDYDVAVTVTTPGGTTQEVPFTVSVTEDDLDGSYDPISVAPGGSETSTPKGSVPEGSTFTKDNGPEWVTVDEDGNITANPPAGTTPGDYPVTIAITTPGGQTQTVEVPVTVIDTTDIYVAEVKDNHDGTWTLIMSDPSVGPFTVGSGNSIESIVKDGDTLVITKADGTEETIDVGSNLTPKVIGEGEDRQLIFVDAEGNQVGTALDLADVHVSKIVKTEDGNYEVYLNNGDKIDVTIAVGDDIDAAVAEIMEKIKETPGGISQSDLDELKTEVEGLVSQADVDFQKKLDALEGRLSNRIDELEQCMAEPHVVLPALLGSVATLMALAQFLQVPGMNAFAQSIPDPLEGLRKNPEFRAMERFGYDNRGVIAVGIGALGVLGLLFMPGLCKTPSVAERYGSSTNQDDDSSSELSSQK